MDEHDIRFKIAAARRMLYREGCDSDVGGHVSARADDGFWVTGFEYFDTTTPDRVAKLSYDLEPLVGELAMSPAVNFHARIYQERADVNAIVHLHSHFISVLSSVEGKQVEMFNVHSVLFHEEQATYFDDGVKSHLAVVDALGDKRVCLMKNHGAIIASDSLENATIEAITLEKAARIQLEAEAIGGTPILEAEVVSGKAMYRKHYLPQMWAANFERLRTSDPGLFAPPAVPSGA
ncbi:MAG: class aldolase/adducin family protein [Actinomycetia bacterium]|nr:class aldolase/adducin family protein [Actinomycetes bacterium]